MSRAIVYILPPVSEWEKRVRWHLRERSVVAVWKPVGEQRRGVKSVPLWQSERRGT